MPAPRGPIAPGPAAVLMAVVLATPAVLRRCKPLAKSLGDILVKAGHEVHRIAGTEEEPQAPNGDVKEQPTQTSEEVQSETPESGDTPNEATYDETTSGEVSPVEADDSSDSDGDATETTKVGAGTEEVDLETASPIAHEEIASQIAAEAKGDGAVPEPINPTPQKEDKPLEPDQPRNPSRQQNSQPE